MSSKKRGTRLISAVAVFTALLLGGTATAASALSVDVKNFHYSDDSGRSILYDFSDGTVSSNAIPLSDLPGVVTRPAGESGTTYFWGQVPALPPVTVTLDTTAQKATVYPTAAGFEGVAVLYTSPGALPAGAGPVSWFYALQLSNFDVDMTAQKAYEFDIGLGRDESAGPYNNATINVVWVKGYFNGVMYPANTLIIQARVQNGDTEIWASTPIVRTGLDPAATTLMFDLSVDSGNHFFAAAKINDEDMTNLGEYTLTAGQGFFQRMPDLFPYLYMEEQNASTALQATVQSFHSQGDGKYYASFHVQDPLHQAFAVRVTGNGNSYVGLGVDLGWNDTSMSWHSTQSYEIGTTPVTTPWPSFIFTFTPQSGGAAIDPVTKNITGYVTEFASDLQPSGSVSTNPVFIWTGITGASGYAVQLNDGVTRIWNSIEIPALQNSVPYNGPALVNGKTYNYNILSNIEQNGVWNVSFANGSFTYTGTAATTISFNGWVKTIPNWPSTGGLAPVNGATVNALNEAGPPPFASAVTNTDGSFSITGIPASSSFRLVVPTPASTTYVPVLSKWFNWTADIQALLPFTLFTQEQYAAFGNPAGTGMILGRVALKNSPTTFLSGATVVATQWLNGAPTGTTYPVTYTGGGAATGADGIYMVKNVPAGTMVQLVVTLANHTFEFNGAVIPVQTGFISEESFFATATQSPFNVYSYHHQDTNYFINLFVDDLSHAFTGVTVNGPDLTGEVSLIYVGSRWILSDGGGISLGTTLPTGARTYNFTAATGGTPVTGSKTVSVYVEGFATNLLPTGNIISGTPTFSWTGITGATSYAVVLNDVTAGNNSVWFSPSLAPDQTSVLYDGPALTAGHTYEYTVISAINTDGNSNSSFALAQFTYTGTASTVTVSGFVRDWNGAVIPAPGVTVTMAGDPTKTTTSSTTDGSFSLAGVPANTPFSLKFSKVGYLDVYSVDIGGLPSNVNINADAYGGSSPFNLPTASDLTAFGAMPASGKALIVGRVSDQTYRYSSNVGGAVVTAQGLSKSYPVTYRDPFGVLGGTATYGNGRYYILNVDGGDTITLSAAKSGWNFPPRTFHTQIGAVSLGRLWGPSPGYDASLSGSVKTFAGAAISGATLALNGDPGKSTVTAADGSYTFGGLPQDAYFYVKVTAGGYVPAFAGPMNLQGSVSGVNLLMLTAAQMTGFGVSGSNGLLGCTVMDQSMNPLSGATVTLTSRSGTVYTPSYDGGGSQTPASGKFLVANVQPGDVVKIEATKSGYTFNPVYLDGFSGAITEKPIFGTGPLVLKGDLNADNLVNLADAILALQVLSGMNSAGVSLSADVNGDNQIGPAEVIYILQEVAEVR